MQTVTFHAIDIAGYALHVCRCRDKIADHMTLQRILFGLQRSFLQTGSILFDDAFVASRSGPVVPSVTKWFYTGNFKEISTTLVGIEGTEKAKRIYGLINKMLDVSYADLTDFTQRVGGAWETVLAQTTDKPLVITNKQIAELG